MEGVELPLNIEEIASALLRSLHAVWHCPNGEQTQ